MKQVKTKLCPTILAIDTSCDDTSVAITQGMKILANVIASQVEIHRKYGGVMPLEAKLAHHEFINPTYTEALKRARVEENNIDAVAVTYGPGLAIALEVGIGFAKEISRTLQKPLIAVNHMKGHLYSPLAVNSKGKCQPSVRPEDFPVLALLVSGGHTELVLLKNLENLEVVGKTIDDAAGEALDKFARMIDLGYPGAAAMEQVARNGDASRFSFPLPMTQVKTFDYSFSGLKTAGRHTIEKFGNSLTKKDVEDLAASFQQAVFKTLLYKLSKAVEAFKPRSIWVGGGVSANLELRKMLRKYCKERGLQFLYPTQRRLNTDNAAMIGVAAFFQYKKQDFIKNLDSLQRVPRLEL
ncbi:MAG: tRNA (adenosine(37)-N6)-threonylcarbamoyltransferase complex transferase subunit TsaD [Patescibacteria group bacterium]